MRKVAGRREADVSQDSREAARRKCRAPPRSCPAEVEGVDVPGESRENRKLGSVRVLSRGEQSRRVYTATFLN